jgi:carbon storage regulator CsrA
LNVKEVSMLVLSRKDGQKVRITFGAVSCTVTAVACQSGKVRLGFDAPRDVHVVRTELTDRGPQRGDDAGERAA